MKQASTIFTMILLLMAGCGGNKQSANDFITVDVTARYPKKELILQDFMDVEYIPLEIRDDFICQDLVVDIGKNRIIVRNYPEDGDIFIFDRNGKAIKKINRRGQGVEEYTAYRRIVLDEDRSELFVSDLPANRILVYDLDGNFKRILKQGNEINYGYVYNFDDENLICNNNWDAGIQPFAVISKKDGSVTGKIEIPFKERISMYLEFEANNTTYSIRPDTYHPILPYFDNWILVEQSTDTVYRYQPDHTITPVIVRTPPVQSMDPEVFLFPSLFTDRYYFMDAVKKEFDWGKYDGFPATHLMYDKQEKTVFEYTVYNGDYVDKRTVNINKIIPVINEEIVSLYGLEVYQLIEDYKNGKLKGQLKEIVAGLDEESNPVIMLIKHKK